MSQSAPLATGGINRVPDELSTSDWSDIRTAYEAQRHAVVAVGDGYLARNPGQRWNTHFDGNGFVTRPDSGGWEWGLELASFGAGGEECAVHRPMSVAADGRRVAYEWSDALTEWYVNDGRGLEHGFTVHHRPGTGSGPLRLALAVRGCLQPELNGDGRGIRFVDADGGTLVSYNGLTVVDAAGTALDAYFVAESCELRLMIEDDGARYPLTIDPIAQQAYLKASNTDAMASFGSSVAVSGDTVVIGAYFEHSSATGVNGNQSNDDAYASGAAYVFVRNGATWSQQAYLKASNTGSGDAFGYSVAVSGDTVVVGAWQEDSSAKGVNGDQSDNSADRAGAAYVFVRNGPTWSQQAYLKASNTSAFDRFGKSVAVNGDTVVVGGFLDDSNATGVDGNQGDNSALDSGAAYIFVRNDTTWSQQAYLKASNTGAADFFGTSVALSGGTIVVGANHEGSNATGVNGNQDDNGAYESGAAYVFVRNGTTWSQQAYLKPSNTGSADHFGESVAVSGDTVIVGAVFEDSNATGVNGDKGDNSALDSGAAYVFDRNGTTWSQQAYLKASNTGAADSFGKSVAVSGDTVLVGAFSEDSNATGVNGNQGDNSALGSGAAYVFVRTGTTWTQRAYIKASNTDMGDVFGSSVAVSGDTTIVGAPGEDSSATGVNGNQADNSALFSGAAYVLAGFIPPDCNGPNEVSPCEPPGFYQSSVIPVGDGVVAIVWGSYFGTFPFIAVAHAGENRVWFLEGLSQGQFQFHHSCPLGGVPKSLAYGTLRLNFGSCPACTAPYVVAATDGQDSGVNYLGVGSTCNSFTDVDYYGGEIGITGAQDAVVMADVNGRGLRDVVALSEVFGIADQPGAAATQSMRSRLGDGGASGMNAQGELDHDAGSQNTFPVPMPSAHAMAVGRLETHGLHASCEEFECSCPPGYFPGFPTQELLDIAVTRRGTNELLVFTNRGNGCEDCCCPDLNQCPPDNGGDSCQGSAFQGFCPQFLGWAAPIAHPVGDEPVALAAADFNEDGWHDVIVANYASSDLSLLMNMAPGLGAACSIPLPSSSAPRAVLAADFNHDGHQDVLVACEGSDSVTLLCGNGEGNLTPIVEIPLPDGSAPTAMTTGDFNGDTRPDLAVAAAGTGKVYVYLNLAMSLPGDFDFDGDVDLFDFAHFVDCAASTEPILPYVCLPFDFDDDNDVDLVDWGMFQAAFD